MSSEHTTLSTPVSGDVFATTHWTVVLAAGCGSTPQADRALEELCRAYWYPLYAYVERSRYAAARTGVLRLRPSHAVGLVLHWPLTQTTSGCRRLAVHDARQTVNRIL